MDAQTATTVLRWYEELEEQLGTFMKRIPPHGKNLQVWSPALATILVEACNLIESVFYHITPDPVIVNKSKKKRDKLYLRDYATLYSNHLRLPERKVVIFQEPLDWCTPFAQWSDATTFPSPAWWNVHNKSKHSRLDHFEDFTLKRARDALAGALVVIATAPLVDSAKDLVAVMIKQGWIHIDIHGGEKEMLDHFYNNHNIKGACLIPETSLFAAILSVTPLPQELGGLKHYLYRTMKPNFMWPLGKDAKLRTWLDLVYPDHER
jgi:hypothetical protein